MFAPELSKCLLKSGGKSFNYNKILILGDKCRINTGEIIVWSRYLGGINHWNELYSQTIRKKIEKYWSSKFRHSTFKEDSTKEKFYILSMFPYPSGFLHLGHIRVYGISDAIARYHRMMGKNVIHPMGWDAFGLPAENAAFERGLNPDDWTQKNIANMKALMEKMNFSFDWDREFATCDSDYYKWTQFLFLKLYESGLVYRNDAYVNWDPVDQTVLADEQVDSNGRSWRSGALIEKKIMRQWFINTTRFSKSLREGLKDPALKNWKDIIKIQEHWIGNVNGTKFNFEVVDKVSGNDRRIMPIWIEKPEYIDKGKFVAIKRKSFWCFGCDSEGLMPYSVKNPFTNEIIPVYLTNAIEYPDGAETYLGIPEINNSDKLFAESVKVFYPKNTQNLATEQELLDFREKICAEARQRKIGGYPTSSKLKDWLVSRQRYWGTPIPIVYCDNCGEQPVPEKELPVRLPEVKSVVKGESILKNHEDWIHTKCPKCGGKAKRETDTLDTFVDSSWYFLRFLDPDNENAPYDVEKIKKLMPVDLYIGGKEHATLHLYYSRFINHFLHSAGLVPYREPFSQLLCQGMVKGKTYKNEKTGEYVKPCSVEIKNEKAVHKESGQELTVDWEKMSKSKHNSVEPTEILSKVGVDTLRLVVFNGGIPQSDIEWNEQCVDDVFVWQRRMWLTVVQFIQFRSKERKDFKETEEFKNKDFYIFDSRNYFLKKVEYLVKEKCDLFGIVKNLQALTNSLRKCKEDVVVHSVNYERALALQIILLAPLAPYFASELWSGFLKAPNRLSKNGEILWDRSVFDQPWPKLDENYQEKSEKVLQMLKLSADKKKKNSGKKQNKKAKSLIGKIN